MVTKFKYLPHGLPIEFLEEEEMGKKVKCPLPYKNLPNGEYLIRGAKKEHRKIYYKINKKWYLIEDVTKDNGHNTVDSTKYGLFPSLPEKEWVTIEAAGYARLNKLWQRHLGAYKHWCDLRIWKSTF